MKSYIDHIQEDNEPNPILSGIYHWEHTDKEDGSKQEAHSLLRVYKGLSKQVVVILSMMRFDNPYYKPQLSIVRTGGLQALANILEKNYKIPTDNILWVSHSGEFSSYDTLWHFKGDSFWEVVLTSIYGDGHITKTALETLINNKLDDGYPAIQALGIDYPSDFK